MERLVNNDAGSRQNPFLNRLRAGELTLMLGIRNARTTDVVRIARSTGHDAILVDLEHSTMPFDVAAALCAAAADLGLTPFVRLPEREYGAIGRLLDGGAQGIIAPRVESADEARTISRACRFAPGGQRSQLASVPQLGMEPTPARLLNPILDATTIVQILVETPVGVAAADAIAAVEGVDMLAIGANDLTSELGVPGQYDHPMVRDAVATVADACRRHGKLMMLGGIADQSLFASLAKLGVCPLQVTGMDTDLLFSAARSRVQSISNWHEPTTLANKESQTT
jgi:2-keto-3-deoxy-L-rhamnonate aldolase RhmA